MNAIVIRRFGGPEVLEIEDVPMPEPGAGQLRIRVAASTVNAIDISTRNGVLADAGLMARRPQVGIGWDVAGTVDETGPGVKRFRTGDAIVGLRDLLSAVPGAHAEYVVLDESAIARAPASASPEQAATLPLNGLTAARALDLCDLRPGQTLLVTGAAGGVGGFALELARLRGLQTVAVAGRDDERLVRELGATDFVARTDALGHAVRELVPGGVDAVIDAAVLGIVAHEALRGGGTFVALVAPFAPPPIRATRVIVQEVFADGARLAELCALVDAGALTLRVAQTFALADAGLAHERLAAGGLRGRVVLVP
jgi:NADPH:quinone reductase